MRRTPYIRYVARFVAAGLVAGLLAGCLGFPGGLVGLPAVFPSGAEYQSADVDDACRSGPNTDACR